MRGLDNFKKGIKENGGYRNVVPSENATNLIDCQESTETVLQEDHS